MNSRNLQALDKLCKEYIDIFSLHQGDTSHKKLLIMDTDRGDHPPTAQKPYALPMKHSQWIHGEEEM